MKSLFFVSVAFSIFSGTSLSASAQKHINAANYNDGIPGSKAYKFIEGIEIKPETTSPARQVVSAGSTEIKPAKVEPANLTGPLPEIEHASALQFKYALLMDRTVELINNLPLYSFIDEWWGTRYRYGGTGKKGIDCSAFSGLLVGTVFGLKLPRTARDQYDATERVQKADLLEGDLVFFHTTRGVSHVGVYLGNGYFVHASRNNGVVISNLEETYYSNRYIGGGRVNETEQESAEAE